MNLFERLFAIWALPVFWFINRFGSDDEGELNILGLLVALPWYALTVLIMSFLIAVPLIAVLAVVFYLPLCVFIFENCP